MDPVEPIPQTDENVPLLAEIAVKQAYQNARDAGQTIVEVRDGKLVESHPDGTTKEIRAVAPGIRVTPGQTYSMQ